MGLTGTTRGVDRSTTKPRRCDARPAFAGLAAVGVALLVDCLALVIDIALGRRLVAGQSVSSWAFDLSSTVSTTANILIPLAVLGCAVVFIRWFHCAYNRLSKVRPTEMTPVWAVAGWFVPVLNLVRPPWIMNELTKRRELVMAWWFLWLAGGLIQVVLRLISPSTQAGWVRWQSVSLMANLLLLGSVACAVALVDVVRRRWARRRKSSR
jgi:hypothetical protein